MPGERVSEKVAKIESGLVIMLVMIFRPSLAEMGQRVFAEWNGLDFEGVDKIIDHLRPLRTLQVVDGKPRFRSRCRPDEHLICPGEAIEEKARRRFAESHA